MLAWATLITAFLFCVSGVIAYAPERPKPLRSDFADFIMKTGYGPRFTSTKTGGKTSVMIPSFNNTEYRNFYEILNITKEDDASTIKKQYRKLAKMYHPDINRDSNAVDKFQNINRAYEVLRDPELKKLYDFYGMNGIGTSAYSDDINAADFEGFNEATFEREVTSSFNSWFDPNARGTNRDKPKFREKRRYVLYPHPNIQKNRRGRAKQEDRKSTFSFTKFHNARAAPTYSP